jgi:hypothetical protein
LHNLDKVVLGGFLSFGRVGFVHFPGCVCVEYGLYSFLCATGSGGAAKGDDCATPPAVRAGGAANEDKNEDEGSALPAKRTDGDERGSPPNMERAVQHAPHAPHAACALGCERAMR